MNNMKWLITVSKASDKTVNYPAWLLKAGISSRLAGTMDDVGPDVDDCDALLLAGGPDVVPGLYGASRRHPETNVDAERDDMEFRLIKAFLSAQKPVFGICRGLQVLAVHYGCGLLQHIPDLIMPGEEQHFAGEDEDASHVFLPCVDTALGSLLSGVRQVNSSHHQAIGIMPPESQLKVAGRSRCGLVEAVEDLHGPIRVSAVQWHPERMEYENSAAAGLLEYWRSLVS
jgi:putative glutamine amidotransferase